MIVIINGAPGTGKTKTAEELNSKIPQSALIDGDCLLAINPRNNSDEERSLRYKLIAEVAKIYYQHGYLTIFIAFVYPGPSSLSEQIQLLSNFDQVKVVSLITDNEELRRRHQSDNYKRGGIENSIRLNDQIKKLTETELIDNTHLSLEQVAEEIIKYFSFR